MTTPVQELHKDLQELFAKDDSALGQTHDGEQTPYHEHLAGEVSAAKQQLMATPGADVLDAQLLMDLAYTAFADAEGHQSNGNFRFAMMAQQTGHECLVHAMKTLETVTGERAKFQKPGAGPYVN